MSRVHVRCANSKCRARRVLKQHPDKYQIIPACNSCSERRYVVDGWMNKRNTRAMGCMCAGYAWPGNMSGAMHRRGSLACYYRSDGSVREVGDTDFVDRNIESLNAEGADKNEYTEQHEYA